jgi:hypothetical protein
MISLSIRDDGWGTWATMSIDRKYNKTSRRVGNIWKTKSSTILVEHNQLAAVLGECDLGWSDENVGRVTRINRLHRESRVSNFTKSASATGLVARDASFIASIENVDIPTTRCHTDGKAAPSRNLVPKGKATRANEERRESVVTSIHRSP